MPIIKKLIFAVPFILSVAVFYLQASDFLKDFSALFSLDLNLLFKSILFAATIVLVSYLFVLFVNFAADWKLVIPVILLAALISFLFTISPINYYLAGGLIIALGISLVFILNKIKKDPTNFQISNDILKPSGQLATLIILAVTVTLYFSATASNQQFVQKFVDSIVDFSSNFVASQQSTTPTTGATQTTSPLSQDQINQLKQNPGLLKQFGLDPSVLNQFSATNTNVAITPQNIAAEAAKPIITAQITDLIKPYMGIIPFLIAFLFYLNFQFFSSVILFISSPIIHLLFLILEKIGFIKYEVTTREVKKIIV